MQGLRPLVSRRHRLARSKLRQADAARRQPSFLGLASQQEKPRSFLAEKQADALTDYSQTDTWPLLPPRHATVSKLFSSEERAGFFLVSAASSDGGGFDVDRVMAVRDETSRKPPPGNGKGLWPLTLAQRFFNRNSRI